MLSAAAATAMIGFGLRSKMDLDSGWEFARVPERPSIWKSADSVPTATWKVLRVDSQELSGENGAVANVFDRDPKTIWHTEWSKRQAAYPHELVIDLGSRVDVNGLRLLTRQTSPQNGRPNHFSLYLSLQKDDWSSPVIEGSAPDSSALFEKRFPPTWAHYLRIVFKDGWKPEPFLALSEIGLTKNVSLKDQTEWSTQYNVANVEVGESKFDLKPDELEQVKRAELSSLRSSNWSSAVLPHTPWIRPMDSTALWQGVTYYRRSLDLSEFQRSRRSELTLEGAMQNSSVWLNGQLVGGRRGGYLPVVLDLTGKLQAHNDLLVRLDNRDNPLIPPGKPQAELDFIYGSGLYRNAYLTQTSPLHVTDAILENEAASGGIYVTYPLVSPSRAIVRVRTHVRNSDTENRNFLLRQRLLDPSGQILAESSLAQELAPSTAGGFSQELIVSAPKLWSPDAPNLYRLETSVMVDGQDVDRVVTRIGIRSVEVSRERGFVLNGKPTILRGTNRHQDYPWVGVALSDQAHKRDVAQIIKAGHNLVRLSHYPHSPAFMDACDELGLMNIPCIPGWQFINRDPRFLERVKQDIRELIRRDRNHPSAVLWEASLNETYPPAALAKEWHDTAKAESVDGRIITIGDATRGAPWDAGYNLWVDEDMSRPQKELPTKPGYIREYGDFEFGGYSSTTRVRIGAGTTRLLQAAWNEVWSLNRNRLQHPWTMGEGTWAMFDDNGPWEFKISAWGLSDLFRRPKPAFYFFQSQAAKDPMLKIVSGWDRGPKRRDVVVFTNCDSADLLINGRLVSHAVPTRGPTTAYNPKKPFDFSNSENLIAPPIVFRDVAYEPGELSVVGFVDRHIAASDRMRTAGPPVRLKLWLDDLGVRAGTNDLVFVRAAMVDAHGAICTEVDRDVVLRVNGAGYLDGESVVKTEMGVCSILVRTDTKAGKISVSAGTGTGLVGDLEFSVPANSGAKPSRS